MPYARHLSNHQATNRAGVDKGMRVLAVDPGNTYSAYVIYDPDENSIWESDYLDNESFLRAIRSMNFVGLSVAVEMIASYGMPVGKDVFETCVFVGRISQLVYELVGYVPVLVYRRDVKHHLCNSAKAKDANVRQAIIDKFPATGGGKIPQVGTKASPGPLFGVSGDIWAALGVALTYTKQ